MNSHAMAKFISLYQVFIVLGTKASSLGLGQESAQGYDPEASITGLYTGPYFDPLAPRNFTAHLGDQAILPCTVRQLGDKSVSWVRMRDADILTVDRYTFVGDERFESHYSAPQETWNLVIKYVQERDAGQYECQVSTEPKMSQFFSLRVVIPKVEILPPGDRYVKAGSEVRVDCQISEVVQLPDYIFWYHEEKRVMDHLDDNLVVAVKSTGAESITSTLSILKVPPEGSGNYTCMPSNLHTASVILHVLNEKHPAAMQGERSGASPGPETQSYILSIIFLLLLLYNAIYYDFNGYGKNAANGKEKKTLLSPSKQFQILTALDNEEDFGFQNPYSTWWNVSGVNRKPEEPGVLFLSPAPLRSRVGICFKPPISNVSSPLANEVTNHDQIISSKLILQDDKLKLVDPKLYDDREDEEEGITTKGVGIRRDLAGKMDDESELVVRADVGLYIGSSSDR